VLWRDGTFRAFLWCRREEVELNRAAYKFPFLA
jgi:hypothetical protein